MFVCLGSLILSFTSNFFAYFKFHSDWGRVIDKIKQNKLDCRDTAPLKNKVKNISKSSAKAIKSALHFSNGVITVKSLISDHSWCTAKWSRSLTGGGLFERVDRMSLCFFSLPYTMGTMEHIKSLVLDGNPLRSLRRDVVMVMFT